MANYCFNEFHEERVRGERAGFELGVKLRAEEEWVDVAREFQYLHQPPVLADAGEDQAFFLQTMYEFGIYFIPVAVTFVDKLFPIGGAGYCAGFQMGGV